MLRPSLKLKDKQGAAQKFLTKKILKIFHVKDCKLKFAFVRNPSKYYFLTTFIKVSLILNKTKCIITYLLHPIYNDFVRI